MTERQSYESTMADLKLKRFALHSQSTHRQAANRDNGEPHNTDDSISPGKTDYTSQPAMSAVNGLKVDQAGMIWRSDGRLVGKVQDDSFANPVEMEGHSVNEKGELLDEEETCWHRPHKSKTDYDKHVDSHFKPYHCDFNECADTHFPSTENLLRHQRAAHKMHAHGAKPYLVNNYRGVEPSEDTTIPSLWRSFHCDAANHGIHDAPQNIYAASAQGRDHSRRNTFGYKEDVSSSATMFETTPCSESNDSLLGKGSDFDIHLRPKHTITSKDRYHPELNTITRSRDSEQPKETVKERDGKLLVDASFLRRLESKISDLQSRVAECEGVQGSTNSSVFDSGDSVDSVSDLFNESGQAATDSQNFDDDDIISCEPEVKKWKRGARVVEGPSLEVSRWKGVDKKQRFEAGRGGMSTPPVLEIPADRPLVTVVSEFDRNQFWQRRVEIASPAFFDLLKEVSRHNMSDLGLHEGVLYLMEPLMVLFLNRKQLTDYVENVNEYTQAKEHAKFILNFLRSDFGDISRALDNFESVTPPNLVKYSDLWMLYRPGTTVYSHANGEWEAFVTDSLDGMKVRKPWPDNCHPLTRLDIRAWSLNFDGEVYGRVWSIHCIAPFHGLMDIRSLPLVPEKFLSDGNAVRDSLLTRGRKFCSLQVQHCQTSEIPPHSNRVIVDHLTYQRRNGWLISINGKYGPSSAKECSWKDNRYSDWDTSGEPLDRPPRRYTPQRALVRHFEDEYCSRDYELESIDKSGDTQAEPCRRYSTDRPRLVVTREFEKYNLIRSRAEMDELALMLCPQHVRGFCLRDKLWKFLNVSQLEPVSFQKGTWDRLILGEEYKDLIETMVSSHDEKVTGLRGLAGGKGLSILLHGEPGVGKTLTAESIAENFGKPLFPVICADIGTSLPRFDQKLEEISDYATRWGAILLFDEADVLIQARRDYERSNLKRNDLVSSFVRFIEYYQGIVFITTNRVSKFDDGLMPRIDITLGLPPLDRGRRVGVWHDQIRGLLDEGIINASQTANLRELALEKWSKENINGHQIKKVVKTARVLAEKKGTMLGAMEVETMLQIGREFGERAGHLKKEKEKENDQGDLEGFEHVGKP